MTRRAPKETKFVRRPHLALLFAILAHGCRSAPTIPSRSHPPDRPAPPPTADGAEAASLSGRCTRRTGPVTSPDGVRYGADIDESVVQHTIHVSPDVDAAAPQSGTPSSPYGSLAAAARAALEKLEAGVPTRILLAPGIYRQSFGSLDFSRGAASTTLLVIEGAGDGRTIVSGADAFPGEAWREEGGGIWSIAWPHDLGNTNVPWNKMTNVLGQRSEMAWIDGRPLVPRILEEYELSGFWTVETEESKRSETRARYVGYHAPGDALVPGSFGVAEREENGNRIYVRPPPDVDLRGSTVELAVRPTLLAMTPKRNLVLRGITFEKTASRVWVYGPVIDFGKPWEGGAFRDVLIEGCSFLWHASTGLALSRMHGLTVRRCRFNYNGEGGASTGAVSGVLWEDNESCFNDWRTFMGGSLWENHNSGGVKWHESTDVLVRRHRSIGNFVNGLWFDVHCRNVTVEDSLVAYNAREGLFFELGQGPFTARRCVLANNDWVQFECMVTGVARAERCIMYASRLGCCSVNQHVRDNEHARKQPISVGESFVLMGNVIARGPGAWNGSAMVSFTNSLMERGEAFDRFARGYRAEGNWYFDPVGNPFSYAVTLDRTERKLNLAGWEELWRDQESGARWVDPMFADPARCDFRPGPRSPLRGREGELPLLALDRGAIDETKAFFAWATTGVHARPDQTLPQFLEFVRGL